ncbi:MAG: thiolase family protein [Candidatus Peribacteraceae bacterium]|nr:thiolase family protein [Candidatus Peribacteraceae bacterium]
MSENPNDPVIVSAVRTPFGKASRGTLVNTRPDDLAALVLREALHRVPKISPEMVEDVLLGCGFPEGPQGSNVARPAALLAGIPDSVPAATVNRFCASGLQTVAQIADRIRLGEMQVGLAGGVESMSMVPIVGSQFRPNPTLIEKLPKFYLSMGLTAERVAERFGVSRAEQDRFAFQSHQRALEARKSGRFNSEIIPVKVRQTKPAPGGKIIETEIELKEDEGVREDTSLEILAGLKTVFKKDGTVTAGNSSPMSDGAGAVLLTSRAKAAELGLKPLARFVSYAVVGVPPDIMGVGPAKAIPKLLNQTGLKLNDIDLFEINEAFAAQILYVLRELRIPEEKINPNGGAIAIGHPLGATGARLTATLIGELQRRKARYGIVSMCTGGGMGAAGLFERLD